MKAVLICQPWAASTRSTASWLPKTTPARDPYQASPSGRFDDLGIKQIGQWHPTRLGPRSLGLTPLGLHPMAIMAQDGTEVFLIAIGQKERDAVRRQHRGDLMEDLLGHGGGARANIQR